MNKLQFKMFLMTRSSGGIGAETARAIAATDAHCFLGCRDLKKSEEACKDFLKLGQVEALQIDVSSLDSVCATVKNFLARSSSLNVLINNAAIMACPEGKTVDGFESQLGINFAGHFLLYKLLEPTLPKSSNPAFNSHVVNVSSVGHHADSLHFDTINLEGEYDP